MTRNASSVRGLFPNRATDAAFCSLGAPCRPARLPHSSDGCSPWAKPSLGLHEAASNVHVSHRSLLTSDQRDARFIQYHSSWEQLLLLLAAKIEASLWTSGKLGHSASEAPTNAKLEKAQKRNFLLSLPFWPTDPAIACQSFFFFKCSLIWEERKHESGVKELKETCPKRCARVIAQIRGEEISSLAWKSGRNRLSSSLTLRFWVFRVYGTVLEKPRA